VAVEVAEADIRTPPEEVGADRLVVIIIILIIALIGVIEEGGEGGEEGQVFLLL
jgi:hypothetical protein